MDVQDGPGEGGETGVLVSSGGTVPVAIFSSSTFDARTVDPLTVSLASGPVVLKGKGTAMAAAQDVNGDGLLDLIVHVQTEALQLSETDTEAVLTGRTFAGQAIRGSNSVRVGSVALSQIDRLLKYGWCVLRRLSMSIGAARSATGSSRAPCRIRSIRCSRRRVTRSES